MVGRGRGFLQSGGGLQKILLVGGRTAPSSCCGLPFRYPVFYPLWRINLQPLSGRGRGGRIRNGAESAATYAHAEGAAPGTWLHAGTPLGHTGHAGLPRLPLLISQPRPSSAADEGLRPSVSLIPLHQACAPGRRSGA